MKNLVLSMLAIASITAMNSCSSESDPINEVTGGDKVEIKLNTGVGAITTKADAVTDLNSKKITILRQDGTVTPTDWTAYSAGNYTATATGIIELNASQKYYDNSATPKNSYFIGVYPQVDPAPTGSNTITFSDEIGDNDILCSKIYDAGNKAAQTDAVANHMEFDHMLSKVNIELIATATAKANFGKVKNITIKNMPKSLNLSLKDRTIAANKDIVNNNTDLIVYENNPGEEIDALTIPAKFLVPGLGKTNANDLQITITTEKYEGETNPITISGIKTTVDGNVKEGTLAGYSHTIKLTFNDNISISTNVTSIETGGDGSGDIQN